MLFETLPKNKKSDVARAGRAFAMHAINNTSAMRTIWATSLFIVDWRSQPRRLLMGLHAG